MVDVYLLAQHVSYCAECKLTHLLVGLRYFAQIIVEGEVLVRIPYYQLERLKVRSVSSHIFDSGSPER